MESDGYKLIRQVGAGVAGPVWMADGPAGRVAMRRFASPAPPGSDEWVADRAHFLQAGRQCLAFRHPRVVPIHDVIDDSDDAWISSDFVEDETLESILKHERLSTAQTNRILRSVAQVLDNAHRSGIVHGDLKPSRILVGDKKSVRLTDFAISPRARRSPRADFMASWVHPYLTPEHLIAPGTIGPRSDVYALAAIAYYMYSGKPPFSSSGDIRAAILRGQLDLPATVSRALSSGLEAPLRKAMSRDPSQRFADCSELIGALEAGMGPAGQLPDEKGGSSAKLIYAGIGSLIFAMVVAGALLFRAPRKAEVAAVVRPAAPSGPVVPTASTGDLKAVKLKKTRGGGQDAVAAIDRRPVAPAGKANPFPPAATREVTRETRVATVIDPPKPRNGTPQSTQVMTPGRPEIRVPPDVYTQKPPGYSLEVYSRKANDPKHLIVKGLSFKYLDPDLGEMSRGDLKAMVFLNGPPPGKGHLLSIVWRIDGRPVDVQAVSPNTVAELDSEPVRGSYDVMLLLDKDQVADYTFRIIQ